MPATWPIKRRGIKYTTRPFPASHGIGLSIPLKLVIRDMLELAQTSKEVQHILKNKNILVDGKRREELKFSMGLMDVLECKDIQSYHRMILDSKGKLNVIPIDKKEGKSKICKIVGKTKIKGATQINLHDGKNIAVQKDSYKVGDSLLITVPDASIKEHFAFKKGAYVLLTSGKHAGDTGTIEDMKADKVIFKNQDGKVSETLKTYIFVVGDGKPSMTVQIEK